MASNGILSQAKKGKCRICQRVRKTCTHVKIVGEVRHGFATGHIWECVDANECDAAANAKLENDNTGMITKEKIEREKKIGRYKEYVIFT